MINATGLTMTFDGGALIAIRMMPWKITSGELAYGTVITEDLQFSAGETIVDDGEVEGTVIDNSSNLYFWSIWYIYSYSRFRCSKWGLQIVS